MGPPTAVESLRKCLTYGADRAVLLTDRFFAGSDTLATSFALAQAIGRIGEVFGAPDLVFAGKQTIDGDTAQVGPGIAKRLGLLQLTYIQKIVSCDPEARTLTVERRAEGGTQTLQTRLPCLVTMLEGVNQIRRGSIHDALRAARAEVVTWNAAEAGITDVTKCGLRGSPTVVKRVFAPSPRAEKARLVEVSGKPAADADALLDAVVGLQPGLDADLTKLAAGF